MVFEVVFFVVSLSNVEGRFNYIWNVVICYCHMKLLPVIVKNLCLSKSAVRFLIHQFMEEWFNWLVEIFK